MEMESFVDEVAAINVQLTVNAVTERSTIIRDAVAAGNCKVVGALYDVRTGEIHFLDDQPTPRIRNA